MKFMKDIDDTFKDRLDDIHKDLLNDKRFANVNFDEIQIIKKVFDYLKEQV